MADSEQAKRRNAMTPDTLVPYKEIIHDDVPATNY